MGMNEWHGIHSTLLVELQSVRESVVFPLASAFYVFVGEMNDFFSPNMRWFRWVISHLPRIFWTISSLFTASRQEVLVLISIAKLKQIQ